MDGKKIARVIGLVGTTAISVANAGKEFVLHIKNEYDYRFNCKTVEQRQSILNIMDQIYKIFNPASDGLPIFFLEIVSLNDYVTTKKVKRLSLSQSHSTGQHDSVDFEWLLSFKNLVKLL